MVIFEIQKSDCAKPERGKSNRQRDQYDPLPIHDRQSIKLWRKKLNDPFACPITVLRSSTSTWSVELTKQSFVNWKQP